MRLRLERSLASWCSEAGYDYECSETRKDFEYLPRHGFVEALRGYGFTHDVSIAIASFFGQEIEHALARVHDLRVLCWYWPNGEEIIFPINSKGSIYIGNSPEFWFDFYPFLRRFSSSDFVYECDLPVVDLQSSMAGSSTVPRLYLGGQTHFGHFLVDTFSPLLSLSALLNVTSISSLVVPPGHSGVTKDLLGMLSLLFNPGLPTQGVTASYPLLTLPSVNGIYVLGDAIVPAKNHRPDSIVLANKTIYKKMVPPSGAATDVSSGLLASRIAYVSRFPSSAPEHDRIANWTAFKTLISDLGIDHLCPTSLGLAQRLDLLKGYRAIITDSGSCALNAMLFANPAAPIYWLQSGRMLSDNSPIVCSQHYQLVANIGRRVFSLIGSPAVASAANSWYDKVEYPLDSLYRIANDLAGHV